jgi:hypothetical protein
MARSLVGVALDSISTMRDARGVRARQGSSFLKVGDWHQNQSGQLRSTHTQLFPTHPESENKRDHLSLTHSQNSSLSLSSAMRSEIWSGALTFSVLLKLIKAEDLDRFTAHHTAAMIFGRATFTFRTIALTLSAFAHHGVI